MRMASSIWLAAIIGMGCAEGADWIAYALDAPLPPMWLRLACEVVIAFIALAPVYELTGRRA